MANILQEASNLKKLLDNPAISPEISTRKKEDSFNAIVNHLRNAKNNAPSKRFFFRSNRTQEVKNLYRNWLAYAQDIQIKVKELTESTPKNAAVLPTI